MPAHHTARAGLGPGDDGRVVGAAAQEVLGKVEARVREVAGAGHLVAVDEDPAAALAADAAPVPQRGPEGLLFRDRPAPEGVVAGGGGCPRREAGQVGGARTFPGRSPERWWGRRRIPCRARFLHQTWQFVDHPGTHRGSAARQPRAAAAPMAADRIVMEEATLSSSSIIYYYTMILFAGGPVAVLDRGCTGRRAGGAGHAREQGHVVWRVPSNQE